MNFKQFHKNIVHHLLGADLGRQLQVYNHNVVETVCGKVFVDYQPTKFSTLEEAKQYLCQQKTQSELQQQIQQELYQEMLSNKVADIIRKYHGGVRITDTLIESYIELASSKIFTTDSVVYELRKHNTLDRLLEGFVDCKLSDGSTVIVSEDTQRKLNNIFGQHPDVVSYMRESKHNFLNVINQLEE